MSKNAHIWADYGVLPEQYEAADEALGPILEACRKIGNAKLGATVLAEARFQTWELPHRIPVYREKHTWQDPRAAALEKCPRFTVHFVGVLNLTR